MAPQFDRGKGLRQVNVRATSTPENLLKLLRSPAPIPSI
jgi:hypothetical protein